MNLELEKKEIARRYNDLLENSYQHLSESDKNLIQKAFDLAVEAHKDQRRKTGEPYIYHPIEVAKIVSCKIGLDATSIVAALLHDVVEDTELTVEKISILFNEKIAKIVRGLSKISFLKREKIDSIPEENFKNILLTLNDDVRVILIKIADRLHNMRTMDVMPHHKQIKIASETLYIYAPLAHRLGLFNIKTELENLGLKYTDPRMYKVVYQKIVENKDNELHYINSFSSKIAESLKKIGLKFIIKGRTKSIFSICKKMISQKINYEEVIDKFAIRIIYESDSEDEKFTAWKIYSIVINQYKPDPHRLRDWISQSKNNGYESLHTTVMGPKGRWIEIQIRSTRMDEIAEKGYAAHFKYKQQEKNENNMLEKWINKLGRSLENKDLNAVDFMEDFKLNLYSKEIFVFTPKGDIISLPKGASVLDFAFSIHTDIGFQCQGAKVRNKLIPINAILNNGDQVEVFISQEQKPSEKWINYVITSKARNKIKTVLKEEEKKIIAYGKELLKKKLHHLKVPATDKNLIDLASYLGLKKISDLFYKSGTKSIENQKIRDFTSYQTNRFKRLFQIKKSNLSKKSTIQNSTSNRGKIILFGNNEERLQYNFSKCCNPIFKDKIFGFLTIKMGITVHKNDCPDALKMQSRYEYRILKAYWEELPDDKDNSKITLTISGEDMLEMLKNITKVISKKPQLNINKLSISGDNNTFQGEFTVTINNTFKLKKLIDELLKIKGVKRVNRIF